MSAAWHESDVADFYNRLVFPSKSSHGAYAALVPDNLHGKKVGDFGCGRSLFIDVFKRHSYDAMFLDISPNALATIDYGEKILASLTNIPLPDAHMDDIYCIGVVHHIPDMGKAISELLRVLKPGGRLILGVYAPGSTQAMLRRVHDALAVAPLQWPVRWITRVLIWIKNRRNGLVFMSEDCSKRVTDILDTPLVRYIPVDAYKTLIEAHGGELHAVSRISQMNILDVGRTREPAGRPRRREQR
jgi:SAM-dependent methyltransferase